MSLFNIGLSHLINKLSLISNRNLLLPTAKIHDFTILLKGLSFYWDKDVILLRLI